MSHVLAKQALHQIFAIACALARDITDGRFTESEAHHRRERLQGLILWLSTGALCQHMLVDIHRRVMAHMHCTTTTLNAFPLSEVSYCPMMLCVRDGTGELQSAEVLEMFVRNLVEE